ncbi:hypothetical protein NMY22_g5907 [Coprinellus aureogranulatus]|nr:hypothetical protein NMY22_g5907 [Coprinellus aureogranulatus]
MLTYRLVSRVIAVFLFLESLLAYAVADLLSSLASISDGALRFTYPGQPDYPQASEPFNLRFSYKPAAIAYVDNVDQVSEVVKVGYDLGYNVVARSGGHSYVAGGLGQKDGSLVIDLSNLTYFAMNQPTAIASIGSGLRIGQVATHLDYWGRALPHATGAYVGWGGQTGYGGYGFSTRMWGLTLDMVVSARVVLANGTAVTASKEENPDLFFAIRGAAPSFGIITSTTVQTWRPPSNTTVYQYAWGMDSPTATAAFDAFQNYSLNAEIPAALGVEFVLVPGEVRGNVTLLLSGTWYGPAEELESVLGPLLDVLPTPRSGTFDVGDYLNSVKNLAGGSLDVSAPNTHSTFYVKSLITPQKEPLTVEAMNAFIAYIANEGFDTDLGWFLQIGLLGGTNSQINSVPADETAFPHRDSLYMMQLYAYTQGDVLPFPEHGFTFVDGIVESFTNNMPEDWDYGAYTNYLDDRLPDYESRYYKGNLPRLKELKRKYDPTGVFDIPSAIKP